MSFLLRASARTRAAALFALALGGCASLAACSASSTRQGAGSGGATSTGSTSSGSNGSSSSGLPQGACTALCATETAACPKTSSSCVELCEFNELEVTWCKSAAAAATACLAAEPAGSFQCDSNGAAEPKSGVCAAEVTAMNDCWNDGPPGGLPDQTAACTAVCMRESSLSCADPSCVSGCEAAVKAGVKCNGAFAAWVTCAWKQGSSAFTCDTETPPRATLKSGLCPFESLLLYTCLAG